MKIETFVRSEAYEAVMNELNKIAGDPRKMGETKATGPYPLRIPENLIELAEAKSRSERTDRATALRQLLYAGAEEYVMELLAAGRISNGKVAELLDTTVYRVHELAAEREIELGTRLKDYRRSRGSTADLLK